MVQATRELDACCAAMAQSQSANEVPKPGAGAATIGEGGRRTRRKTPAPTEDLHATLTKDPHKSLQASTFQGEESEYTIPIFTYFISLYD